MTGVTRSILALLRRASVWTALQDFAAGITHRSLPVGSIVGRDFALNRAYATIATVIPNDNTVPLKTEGGEIFSRPYAVKKAGNRIRITCHIAGVRQTSGAQLTAALFIDDENEAIAAAYDLSQTASTSNAGCYVTLIHEFEVADTNERLLKIRAGVHTGNLYLNGNQTAQLLGGVLNGCVFVLEEIQQ